MIDLKELCLVGGKAAWMAYLVSAHECEDFVFLLFPLVGRRRKSLFLNFMLIEELSHQNMKQWKFLAYLGVTIFKYVTP